MVSLTRFVERRLRLKVNEEKSVVARPEAVHILGFSLQRPSAKTPTEVGLSRKTISRIRTRLKELTPRTWGQPLESLFRKLNEYLEGWGGYFSLCTETGAKIFKVIDSHIRRRVRCLIMQRFNRDRFLMRHLVSRGASEKAAAKLAFSSRGLWSKSLNPVIHRAYPNKWFVGKLYCLWDNWLRLNIPPAETGSGQLLLGL